MVIRQALLQAEPSDFKASFRTVSQERLASQLFPPPLRLLRQELRGAARGGRCNQRVFKRGDGRRVGRSLRGVAEVAAKLAVQDIAARNKLYL